MCFKLKIIAHRRTLFADYSFLSLNECSPLHREPNPCHRVSEFTDTQIYNFKIRFIEWPLVRSKWVPKEVWSSWTLSDKILFTISTKHLDMYWHDTVDCEVTNDPYVIMTNKTLLRLSATSWAHYPSGAESNPLLSYFTGCKVIKKISCSKLVRQYSNIYYL